MKQTIALINLVVLTSLQAMENPYEYSSQNWDGEHYEEYSDQQFQTNLNYLNTLDLTIYTSILDLGCGTGKTTAYIAEQAPHATVVGIDLSENMIKTAQEKYGGRENITFLVEDAQNFDLGKTFQLIVSFAVFQFIDQKESALASIMRALEPGGSFHLRMGAIPKKPEETPTMIAYLETAKNEIWRNHFKNQPIKRNLLYKKELNNLLKNTGFQLVQVEKIIREYKFFNREKLNQWINGWIGGIPAVASLETEQRLKFVSMFVKNYVNRTPASVDGAIIYKFPALIAQAQKPDL